ncbi:MAG TPA: tail fiber domain-containing protein [Ignavibacteria bacterium]|nr:tail fiber domain-containing protein [Ignavibacteria bacterium]
MKTIIILIISLIFSAGINSQNINGKLGIGGQFILRDTNNTFLTLPQSTGYLNLNRSMVLPNTTGSTIGVIYKGAERLLHNYGTNNLFLGINAGNFTMTGLCNLVFGYNALYNNTTGIYNTSLGVQSLTNNTTGDNNTSVGFQTLAGNLSGDNNTATGHLSLSSNTSGSSNTAVGFNSLANNTSGSNNVALGNNAGGNITIGSNNITIGNGTSVPNSLGSNQIRLGNTSITYAGIQVAWTITSDSRLKSNIKNSDLGLSFINKLRPVSYTRLSDENQKTEYGFISQEVDVLLKEVSRENTGMISVDNEGTYSLRYNDLIAPMVKAIQELAGKLHMENAENENLKEENKKLAERLDKLEQLQSVLLRKISELDQKDPGIKNTELGEK